MANDLSLLGGNLPAHLQGQLDETTKALMGNSGGQGSGSSVKRISIRGSVFRMVDGGKEIAKNDDRAMNIIIVAAAPHNARSYYTKTWTEGSAGLLPDCFSDDGIKPSERSENKQCDTCKDCPQNIAGSGQNGSRACRFSRRLAVLLENDQKGDVMQLTLPASSIFGKADNGKMPLEAYVKLLGANRVSVTSVVTEMRFDTSSSTPKLTFKAVRYLEADEYANAQAKGKTPEAKTATGSTPAELDSKPVAIAKPAPAPAPKAAPVEEVAEPVKRATKKEADAPKDINSVLDDWA
jgi:hypothetical protein